MYVDNSSALWRWDEEPRNGPYRSGARAFRRGDETVPACAWGCLLAEGGTVPEGQEGKA